MRTPAARSDIHVHGLSRTLIAAFAVSAAGCADDALAPTSDETGKPDVDQVSAPVATGCCGGLAVDPATNGLRLSLVNNQAVPKGDTSTSTTAYFVPFESNAIALYDPVAYVWSMRTMTTQGSLTNAGVSANKSYEVYAYWTGSDVGLEKVEIGVGGPVAPATRDGVQLKSTDMTRRYVGVLATNASATFEDSAKNRLVWNRNNQVPRQISGVDSSGWNYTGPAWREVRGNPASRVTVVAGFLSGSLTGAYASVQALGSCSYSAGTYPAAVSTGIGIDSTTSNLAQIVKHTLVTNTAGYMNPSASYEGYLAAGLHTISWLESSQSAATTFYCTGSFGSAPNAKYGLSGSIVM